MKKTSVVSLPVVILSIHTILCQISELIAVLAGEQRAERAELVCSLCSLMFTGASVAGFQCFIFQSSEAGTEVLERSPLKVLRCLEA